MYVVFEGRYPVRITQSLLLVECAVLAVIAVKEVYTKEVIDTAAVKWGKKLYSAGLVVFGAYMLFLSAFSYVRMKHVFSENKWRLAESQDLRDLKAYCEENQDWFYFVDTKSVTNDTENIFDSTGSRQEQYIVFGGWLSGSPVFERKLVLAGADDVENSILSGKARVIGENEERCPTQYIENYFNEKYGSCRMSAVDSFGRNGEQFLVYSIEKQ